MIVVAGSVLIDPAKREEAVRVVLAMVEATKKEEGCITYDFYADLADPNRFHVFEEWASQEALDAHFQSAHMAEFQTQLPGLIADAPVVNRYEVASVSRLM